MPDTKTTAKSSRRDPGPANVWSKEERDAMQESARERKAATPRGSIDGAAEGERAVQAKIAGLPSADRAMAERIHTLVTDSAPDLVPRTYYGMPAYAKGGKVICFFKPASKFNVRYATFEFQADASLDDGDMWPVAFAVTKLTARVEARIGECVRKAVG